MRRSVIACLLVSAWLTGCAQPVPPSPPPGTREEIVAARDAVWRAYFNGDSTALMALLPATMVGMGKSREAIIADALAFKRDGGTLVSLSFSDDEFVLRGDAAMVVSHYRVETATKDQTGVMTGQAIELFTRQDGRWVNPFWHLHDM